MVAIEPIEEILEAGESLQLQTEDASLSPAVVGSEKSKGNLGDLLYDVHSKHFTSILGVGSRPISSSTNMPSSLRTLASCVAFRIASC